MKTKKKIKSLSKYLKILLLVCFLLTNVISIGMFKPLQVQAYEGTDTPDTEEYGYGHFDWMSNNPTSYGKGNWSDSSPAEPDTKYGYEKGFTPEKGYEYVGIRWNPGSTVSDSFEYLGKDQYWNSDTGVNNRYQRRVELIYRKLSVTKYVSVFCVDKASGAILETVKNNEPVTCKPDKTNITEHAPNIDNYDCIAHAANNDGSTPASYSPGSSMTYTFTYTGPAHVYIFFQYTKRPTPTDPPASGNIVFNPNSTDWTNKGKTGEGSGSYCVEVSYNGQDPATGTGTVQFHHYEVSSNSDGSQNIIEYYYTSSFQVTYKLQSIEVSGDAYGDINGNRGTVAIEREGGDLKLDAIGKWSDPVFTLPQPGSNETRGEPDMPKEPEEPTGSSGIYQLDWTKPSIDIEDPDSQWVRDPVPNPVRVSIEDNLSGFNTNSTVAVSDSSHYKRNSSNTLPSAELNYEKEIMLDEGIYNITANITDRAGNNNIESKGDYCIDKTPPEANFNVPKVNSEDGSNIFSINNGAIREGDRYYGILTLSDNLSGVNRAEYSWTFNDADTGDYTELKQDGSDHYSCLGQADNMYQYTKFDRYLERPTFKIEKPVGDNLYLHVKLWDTAENYTYKVFGPFEDPIKLKGFEVTEVTDPAWQNVFWKDLKNRVATGTTYSADKLPIDESSHPTYKTGALPKKGYAFKFDITSEYLYRNYDKIEILPTFYYYDGSSRIPVDLYYNYDNNPFILMGSPQDKLQLSLPIQYKPLMGIDIGQLNKLTLKKDVRAVKDREWEKDEETNKYIEKPWYFGEYYTTTKGETYSKGWKDEIQYVDGKEQWWYGTYYIPPNAVFTKKGDMPYKPGNVLDKNKIIVNFQITGSKNTDYNETLTPPRYFTYVPEQWKNERGPKSGIYLPGDVMVYDNYRTALMDYEMRVTQ